MRAQFLSQQSSTCFSRVCVNKTYCIFFYGHDQEDNLPLSFTYNLIQISKTMVDTPCLGKVLSEPAR